MYVFAVVQSFFMLAQLAVLIDAASRVFAGDVNQKIYANLAHKDQQKRASRP